VEFYRCFCITKARLNILQTPAVRKRGSLVEDVSSPGQSQKDASISKDPWRSNHRQLFPHRDKSLLFPLFLLGKFSKKTPALIVSSLKGLERGQFISSDLPIPPRIDQLLKRYLKISSHFVCPSSSSAFVLMGGRSGGMEPSLVFSGFK